VTFAGAGGNEVVAVVERPDPAPAADEVVVAARFAGVNWADVAQRQGSYPPPPGSPQDIPGLEVAGVVAATGDAVRAWRIGDRVFGLRAAAGSPTGSWHERHVPWFLAPGDGRGGGAGAAHHAHDAVFTQCGLRLGETLLKNANGAAGRRARLGPCRVLRWSRTAGRLTWPSARERGALVVTPEALRSVPPPWVASPSSGGSR
jgi:hypothetical protein